MSVTPCIGILALQGAFREHAISMQSLGAQTREVRQLKDLDGIDAMVIPGGESTTIGKLLNELEMLAPLTEKISRGMPVFGTCAGLILLARNIEGREQPRIGLLDVTVRRNAFGRQVDSFEMDLQMPVLGDTPFPAVFIRAPIIISHGPQVDILAAIEQEGQRRAVAVRQNNILAISFHPELTGDTRVHKYFLDMVK